jgi:AcrR family transcriptional regulator
MPVKPKNPRGRPRDPAVRQAILAAAAELIEKGGLGAVTMEAVAERAGAGKPTIYRYWPNREALAMAALMASASPQTHVRPSASAIDDLRRQLRKVVDVFASPRGRNAVLMTASADPDSELSRAFRNQVMLASREEGRALLQRAQASGEVRTGLDVEVALDMIYGSIFYRLLMGHALANEAFTTRLVDEAIRGLGKALPAKR